MIPFEPIKKRRDFLFLSQSGHTYVTPAFILKGVRRPDSHLQSHVRFGLTCSRKIGHAVLRNRAKRRLRALSCHLMPRWGQKGWDYVLIGRHQAPVREYEKMHHDLVKGLRYFSRHFSDGQDQK